MDPFADVYQILLEAQAPLHFSVIMERLVALGYANDLPTGPTATHVYNVIYTNIRKQGEHAKFKRTGRATFCAVEVFSPDKHALAAPNSSPSDPYRKPRLPEPMVPKACGTCRYLEFNGPHQLNQTYGTCSLWEATQRLTNRVTAPGCDRWARRSKAQRLTDATTRYELLVLANNVSAIVQSGRSYGPIEDLVAKRRKVKAKVEGKR